jgi:hypothetical protein
VRGTAEIGTGVRSLSFGENLDRVDLGADLQARAAVRATWVLNPYDVDNVIDAIRNAIRACTVPWPGSLSATVALDRRNEPFLSELVWTRVAAGGIVGVLDPEEVVVSWDEPRLFERLLVQNNLGFILRCPLICLLSRSASSRRSSEEAKAFFDWSRS